VKETFPLNIIYGTERRWKFSWIVCSRVFRGRWT